MDDLFPLPARDAAGQELKRVAAQYHTLRHCYARVRAIAPQAADALLHDCIGISYSYEAAILNYRASVLASGADATGVASVTAHLDHLYRTRAALLRNLPAMYHAPPPPNE